MNILLGVTGSVAATLAPRLVYKLLSHKVDRNEQGLVEVIFTRGATYFYDPRDTIDDVQGELIDDRYDGIGAGPIPLPPRYKSDIRIWSDSDEFVGAKYKRNQPVLHIDLRKRADIMVIAPCTADMLASLAGGRADTLLTCVMRAWDFKKPVVIAPAMNTLMWNHPATQEHIAKLREWHKERLTIVDPVSKLLACGEAGIGALAPVDDIVKAVRRALS